MKRLEPDSRRSIISRAAAAFAAREGINNLTHEAAAAECLVNTSPATVRRYFPTNGELIDAVLTVNPKLRSDAIMFGLVRCQAIQQSDEMYCAACNSRWDVNDPEPPKCGG